MPMSEHELRTVLEERSTPSPDTEHRGSRLAEIHTGIRRSRHRRRTAGALVGAGALVAAAIAGPALISDWQRPGGGNEATIQSAGQPRAGGGEQKSGEGESDETAPITTDLETFADAEELAARLRDLGVDASAVDEPLELDDPESVLGHRLPSGNLIIATHEPADASFTIDPEALADVRLIIAMGLVNTDPGTDPPTTERPVVLTVQETTSSGPQDSRCIVSESDPEELLMQVFLGDEVDPTMTCHERAIRSTR